MNYNDAPSSSQISNTQTNNITLEGLTKHISVFQGMIGNLAANAQNIIPVLGEANIINATCKVAYVEGSNGMRKICYLQFQTSEPS